MTKIWKLGCSIAMSLGLLGGCGAPEATTDPSYRTVQLSADRTAMTVQDRSAADTDALPVLGMSEQVDGEAARCTRVILHYCKDPRTGTGTCSCTRDCSDRECAQNCYNLYCKTCTTAC